MKRAAGPTPVSLGSAKRDLASELRRAEELLARQAWAEARDLLESLSNRYPRNIEVWSDLLDAYYNLGDTRSFQWACEQLVGLAPNDPDYLTALAGAYLANDYPALALRTFRDYVRKHPNHEGAQEAREMLPLLEATIVELLSYLDLSPADAVELATLHEEASLLLNEEKLSEARKIEERLLRKWPDFVPALNNMSLLEVQEGRYARGIELARRVLTLSPGNVHALSNLARYHCLSGRLDEAASWGEQLRATRPDQPEWYVKKVEGLSYLGDDAGVVEAFESATRDKEMEPLLDDPLFYHLAAVAYMRMGRDRKARNLWNRALELDPEFSLAENNLADLTQPRGERHAPWPFTLDYWLTNRARAELALAIPRSRAGHAGETAKDSKNDAIRNELLERGMRRFLRKHQEIEGIVPALLDRGDEVGRQFAIGMASLARTPAMLQALRDFAVGERGPDGLRLDTARTASEAGLIPPGPVPMWVDGKQRDVLLLNFNITHEPTVEFPARIERLLAEGVEALRERRGTEAEQLFNQALEAFDSDGAQTEAAPEVTLTHGVPSSPGSPARASILNNLAQSYEIQGRHEEAEKLLKEISERYPDYFFARIALARKLLQDKGAYVSQADIEEAEALLKPLLSRRDLHYSEFAALCSAQIELGLAQGNRALARSWLELWESVGEDDLRTGFYRLRLRERKRKPKAEK